MSQYTNKINDYIESSGESLNDKKYSSLNDKSEQQQEEPENKKSNCTDDSLVCLNNLANKNVNLKTPIGYKKDVEQSANSDNIITNTSNYNKIQSIDKNKKKIPFWSDDPNIILNQKYILEFFPSEDMSYEQKLNAISRLIFILTIIGFLFTQSIRLVVVSTITIFSIYLLYKHHNKNLSDRKSMKKENFTSTNNKRNGLAEDIIKQNNEIKPSFIEVFDQPSESNPFANVLMTDYDYNPNKKPAGPSYTDTINEDIKYKTKGLITNLNSTQPDINSKIFKDLGDELYFEQSMRQFYSNPSTTIPNDQTSFADFCYGGMISCKEGNMLACARNLIRHQY